MALTLKVNYPDLETGEPLTAVFEYPNRVPTENPPEITVRVWEELIDEGVFDRLGDLEVSELFSIRVEERIREVYNVPDDEELYTLVDGEAEGEENNPTQ